jgi:hypothetical protein
MTAAAINVNLGLSFALGRSTGSSPMSCTTASPDHGRKIAEESPEAFG